MRKALSLVIVLALIAPAVGLACCDCPSMKASPQAGVFLDRDFSCCPFLQASNERSAMESAQRQTVSAGRFSVSFSSLPHIFTAAVSEKKPTFADLFPDISPGPPRYLTLQTLRI